MRFSYKITTAFFLFMPMIPILIAGFLVHNRIQERQIALQLFLKNQTDIDRKIITIEGVLRKNDSAVRHYILNTSTEMGGGGIGS